MPSSENRRRLEVPRRLYDRLKQVAVSEERSVTSVVTDLLSLTLPNYCPSWDRDGQLATRLDGHARRSSADIVCQGQRPAGVPRRASWPIARPRSHDGQ